MLVPAGAGVAEALGMRLPPGLDSDAHTAAELLPRLFESLSPDTLVPVIDVETQSEREPMSLGAAARCCFVPYSLAHNSVLQPILWRISRRLRAGHC